MLPVQKKQQAGMLSQSDYLQGVVDYYSADAKETAVVNLESGGKHITGP